MFWITCLKLFFWVAVANWHRGFLTDIEEEMDTSGENSHYNTDDWGDTQDKFVEAMDKIVRLVGDYEIKYLKVLGVGLCKDLLERRLVDTEEKIKFAPDYALAKEMSAEVYAGYYLGLEAKRNNIRRDLVKLPEQKNHI